MQRTFYPQYGPTNVELWGLHLLCVLLQEVCNLTSVHRKDFGELLTMRNNLCHLAEPTLCKEDFEEKLEKLTVIFDRCQRLINDKSFEEEINALVTIYANKPIPIHEIVRLNHHLSRSEQRWTEVLDNQTQLVHITSEIPDEFQTDPYAMDLYEKALKHGKERENSIRVNIIGTFNQGKTSLLRRLVNLSIDDVESTNGIDIKTFECTTNEKEEFVYEEKALEDKRYRRILEVTKNEIKKSKNETEKNTSTERLAENERTSDVLPGDIIYTRLRSIDPMKPLPSLEIHSKLLTSKQISSLPRDALQTSEIDRTIKFDFWDFGGQFLFYATHSLFHSRRAIYLLVFDLTKKLSSVVIDTDCPVQDDQKTMQYYFEFWMNSIHSFVGSEDGVEPIVMLIGTHKDQLEGDEKKVQSDIEKYFDSIRALFDRTSIGKHLHLEDFAVDNTICDSLSLSSIRKAIMEISKEHSAIDLPAKWILLETSINARKHLKIISFQFLLEIDSKSECPVNDVDEVKLFLRYHHAKGTYVYIEEPHLEEYVIVEPQFLADAFKRIITCERFTQNDPSSIRPLRRSLLSEAKLDEQLIEFQWSKDKTFIEHKDILMMFLKKNNILSEATHYDEKTNSSSSLGWYIVPSFLKNISPHGDIEMFFKGKVRTMVRFLMGFDNSSIVPIVYQKLISASVGRWPIAEHGIKPMIFQNLCVVRLDVEHVGVIGLNLDCIQLFLLNLRFTQVNSDQADRFRRFSEAVVNHEFRKLKSGEDEIARPYTVYFKCNHESHGVSGSKKCMKNEELAEKLSLPCPDLESHIIESGVAAKAQWYTEIKTETINVNIVLKDDILGPISQTIGKNWELLAVQLGLSSVQIDHINEECQSAPMKRYRMLQKWRKQMEQMGKDATMKQLVAVMINTRQVNIEWNEIRNLIDKLEKKLNKVKETDCQQLSID